MEIRIKPSEIVTRCLWDNYVRFVIGNEHKAKEILLKDEEILLSDNDAFLIGLLKTLEITNLIHKFNDFIWFVLRNKSKQYQNVFYISKKTTLTEIDLYMNNFPSYWTPNKYFEYPYKELVEYVNTLKDNIENGVQKEGKKREKTETFKIPDKNHVIECYKTSTIKKLLKFNFV